MKFTPSTEIVVADAAAAPRRGRRGVAKAAAAAALSISFAATFAVPAYANVASEDPIAYAMRTGNVQGFTAAEANAALPAVALDAELVVVEPEPQAQQAAAEQRTESVEQRNSGNTQATAAATPAVPAGHGSAGLLAAARAQIGVAQDCTDLVQNSLAALGLTTRRDQGGYDHGVADFARYGTPVSPADAQPGDIMISGGHVAIYAGNGTAVHGGYLGFQTVEVGGWPSSPSGYYLIVRLP